MFVIVQMKLKVQQDMLLLGELPKLAQRQIQEAAVRWAERGRPIQLTFPENMEKLNVLGLMILAKMNQLKMEQERAADLISVSN